METLRLTLIKSLFFKNYMFWFKLKKWNIFRYLIITHLNKSPSGSVKKKIDLIFIFFFKVHYNRFNKAAQMSESNLSLFIFGLNGNLHKNFHFGLTNAIEMIWGNNFKKVKKISKSQCKNFPYGMLNYVMPNRIWPATIKWMLSKHFLYPCKREIRTTYVINEFIQDKCKINTNALS